MTIRVRQLQKGQGLLWRDLRLAALADSPDAFATTYESQVGRSEAEWKRMLDERVADPRSASFVAEIEGESAGMAFCQLDTTDRRVAHVYSFWVAPRFRRRGVGRALLASALVWIRTQGAQVAELSVNETSESAISLYAAAGFADTGRREPLREGSPQQRVVMRCTLGIDGS